MTVIRSGGRSRSRLFDELLHSVIYGTLEWMQETNDAHRFQKTLYVVFEKVGDPIDYTKGLVHSEAVLIFDIRKRDDSLLDREKLSVHREIRKVHSSCHCIGR